jgi:hypothetical protein
MTHRWWSWNDHNHSWGTNEWVSDYCWTWNEQFFSYIMARTNYILMRWWWCPLCSRPTHLLDFYSAGSLKQQSTGRHVASLWHICLIPSQPVFDLIPKCCKLTGEATDVNFIVFGMTRPRHELISTALEASMLIIAPPMRVHVLTFRIVSFE